MHDAEAARRALGLVRIVPPDGAWPEHFSRERERLRPILGPTADQLQHYGSTAVPGLSAKPIIDMMGPTPTLAHADELGLALESAGYRKIDAGFFKRRFFRKEATGPEPAFHLHLAVAPEWPIKNEILLRDWLIEHPEIAQAYEGLKLRLAAVYADDMPRYTEGKTAFLRKAVNDARLKRGLPVVSDWTE